MPKKVDKCVSEKLSDSQFAKYYEDLVKKKGKTFQKKYPDKKSLAWAICTKSVQGDMGGIMFESIRISGAVNTEKNAIEDFKDIGIITELGGKPNRKLVIYDLLPFDMVSEHEGVKTFFPLGAGKKALPSILMTPIHISKDREHHYEETGEATVIGHIVAGKIKKIDGTNYLRVAGFLYDNDFSDEVKEIGTWSNELGASFEVFPRKTSEFTEGVISIDEFDFSGSALLKKSMAAYPSTQIIMASKDGNTVYVDMEYYQKTKEFGGDLKAGKDNLQGMVLKNSFQELNNLIRAKLRENDPNYDLSLVATFPDHIIYRDYKTSKYYKMSYKKKDDEITFSKPTEVKMKFVKAELDKQGRISSKTMRKIGGEKIMSKLLGIGANFCETCQPILAEKVDSGDLIIGNELNNVEIVKDLQAKLDEATSENDSLKTENATLKGEKDALEVKVQETEDATKKAETDKAIAERFNELKGEYQEADHENLKKIIERQLMGYKDIENEAERLTQASKDGEFLVSQKNKSDGSQGIVMGGAHGDNIGDLVGKINVGKEAIL